MTRTTLLRWAGGAAVLAGLLRAIGSFTSPAGGEAVWMLYLTTDVLLLLGTLGWFAFQRRAMGQWGVVGFVLALFGAILLITDDVVQVGGTLYPVAAFCFALGSSVLAVVAWAARILPRWALALVIISLPLGILGVTVPGGTVLFVLSGVCFGIGYARVGLSVWRRNAPAAPKRAPEPLARS